ncbi:MAG TPA: 4Fe-4S binding protein, partial [Roseimicrobium sp.]|nr:4Fe-4S binding protein [Roseimicrobium sp.]
GKDWDEVATLDLKKEGIEGVSGATMTSMAMAQSFTARLKATNEQMQHRPAFQVGARDIGLLVVIVVALVMAFSHLKGRKTWRRVFQAGVVIYIGILNGDLLAQSLIAGWAKSGVPWNLAPGLVLLLVAALLVPWATKKPLYCLHICPHGAAQEWLGRLGEKRGWRVHIPAPLGNGLRKLPSLMLLVVLLVVMLVIPFDLAGIEPFDAYIIRSAGGATIAVAIVGLIASIFVPQAYCRYGCPTGALLEFVRSHGVNDRFGARDAWAMVLVLVTVLIYWKFPVINAWLTVPQ